MTDFIVENGPVTIELPHNGVPAGFTLKIECGGQKVIVKQPDRATMPIPPEAEEEAIKVEV